VYAAWTNPNVAIKARMPLKTASCNGKMKCEFDSINQSQDLQSMNIPKSHPKKIGTPIEEVQPERLRSTKMASKSGKT
jgi:hypothetical protein